MGVGQHQRHVTAPVLGIRGPIQCSECHQVPADVQQPWPFRRGSRARHSRGGRGLPQRNRLGNLGAGTERVANLEFRFDDLHGRVLSRWWRATQYRPNPGSRCKRPTGFHPTAARAAPLVTAPRRSSRGTRPESLAPGASPAMRRPSTPTGTSSSPASSGVPTTTHMNGVFDGN